MNYTRIAVCIAVMAIITYLVRMLPMALFKRKITNRTIRSFLAYVPYAVLAAMTFPEVFYSTDSLLSAIAGTLVALLLACFGRGLLTVAVSAAAAAFLTEQLLRLL